MTFKENLLKKIEINRLVRHIAAAIGPVESGKRIDKALLKQLMKYFPWPHRQEREMALYLENEDAGKTRILVLDNDLTIYRTTVEDVLLRKNPTVKEMVNIRNAIKILNDKDVVVSKKDESLKTLQQICIGELDLNYTDADIQGIADEGKLFLENGDAPGVQEDLMLFAELLDFVPAPKLFAVEHFNIYGKLNKMAGGESSFGPLVMYSLGGGTLTCLDTPIRSKDKGRFDLIKAAAEGKEEPAASGSEVFDLMAAKVIAGAGA